MATLQWGYPVTEKVFRRLSRPLARILLQLGLSATQVTGISFIIGLGSSVLFAYSTYWFGALLLLVSEVMDCADGDLAKLSGTASKRGAFIDSSLDRVVDGAVIIGLVLSRPNELSIIGSILLFGTVLVSYTRARAESLGVECCSGVATRDVRITVLLIGVVLVGLLPEALTYTFLLLAALTLFTSAQRAVQSVVKLKALEPPARSG